MTGLAGPRQLRDRLAEVYRAEVDGSADGGADDYVLLVVHGDPPDRRAGVAARWDWLVARLALGVSLGHEPRDETFAVLAPGVAVGLVARGDCLRAAVIRLRTRLAVQPWGRSGWHIGLARLPTRLHEAHALLDRLAVSP